MRILGILFIISLILLMVIPIGYDTSSTSVVGFRGDYVIHLIIYLPWMFIRRMIFGERVGKLCWFIIGLIVVAGLEYLQLLLPYRGFNINDILAGFLGVLASGVMSYAYRRIKPKE